MRSFKLLPNIELRPYVDRIWGWESTSRESIQLPTLLPGTGAELYFHFDKPFEIETKGNASSALNSDHLFCIRKQPVTLAPSDGVSFIAVRFKVGMLRRFTNVSEQELMDRQLSVEDIWGRAGNALIRRLSYAANHQEKIALIQAFLSDRLTTSSDQLIEQAGAMLYRRAPSFSIDSLAHDMGLGRRQLERRWKLFSGLSPSELRSLIRFQKTMRGVMLDPTSTTTDKALTYGYYDQAHFIHDFQHRVGTSPSAFVAIARSKTHFYNTPLRPIDILATPN